MVNVVLDDVAPLVVLELKVDVLERLGHPGLHLLGHGQVEHKDLLLTMSVEHAVPLILGQIVLLIVLGEDCLILLLGCGVPIINSFGHFMNVLPHFPFLLQIEWLDVVALEHVREVKALRRI